MKVFFYFLATTLVSPGNLPRSDTNSDQIINIRNIVWGITGAIALLIIVISGLRYVVSDGDPGRISKAKNGIIYALVGLIIALVAEAVVSFVVNGVS